MALGIRLWRARGWLWKLVVSLFVLLVAAPVLLLLLYRFVPVPGTPEMLVSLIEGKGARHSWTDDISPRLERAVIGAEDQNFCTHHGFDWASIDKAMADHQRHPKRPMRGASTISQQAARTLFLVPMRSWIRKGLEAWLTVLMEQLWPKKRILHVYLNLVDWGDGIFGAEAASQAYFGTDAGSHVSALGADAESNSEYAVTKAEGEKAVREAFPKAVILRPSIVFGPEDGFFNKFAALARFTPALPLIGGGRTRFQPVFVGDVAQAIVTGLSRQDGRTYELGGPAVYSFKELLQLILRETGRRRLLVPLPFGLAMLKAAFLQVLPKPLLTMDQVRLLKKDNVVASTAPGLAELGITPTSVEAVVPSYLWRFHPKGEYASAQERREAHISTQ